MRHLVAFVLCIGSTAALAESVVTSSGIVVQGRVLRCSNTAITIEFPLYGGIAIRRDAVRTVYPLGANVAALEDQAAMDALADAQARKTAEIEEIRRKYTQPATKSPVELPVKKAPAAKQEPAPAPKSEPAPAKPQPAPATQPAAKTEPAPAKPQAPATQPAPAPAPPVTPAPPAPAPEKKSGDSSPPRKFRVRAVTACA